MKNIKCRSCFFYRNEWCEKIVDSPDPEEVRGCAYFREMTNANKIRSMTDEELVNLHYGGSAHCIADDPTVCDRHDFIGNLTPCEQCYLKWLQQPAGEEDKHGSN